jgi:hypothetical protein
VGTDSDSNLGTKFDRARTLLLLGGDVLRSIAEADRAGGGPTLVPLGCDLPGDVVCDLDGGGGGWADLGGSVPPPWVTSVSCTYNLCFPHLFVDPALKFFVINE